MPRTSLAWLASIRSCCTHSSTAVRTPRLIWRSSARVRRWSVAARSWSTMLGERSNLLDKAACKKKLKKNEAGGDDPDKALLDRAERLLCVRSLRICKGD